MSLEFNSRSTYLAAVAQWKADYASHSQKIRDTRLQFRQAESAASKEQGPWSAVEKLRGDLARLRAEATLMIDHRVQAKKEAGRQYAESHAVCV